MSKTRKQYTKRELVTAEIHRKAGPHKVTICPECEGRGVTYNYYPCEDTCYTCKGEGMIDV